MTGASLFEKIASFGSAADAGDTDAALVLAMGIARCSNIVVAGLSLEDRVNSLYETRRPHQHLPQVENLNDYERLYKLEHSYCEGISRDHISEHFRYMLIAAENGSTFAQTNLLSEIAVEDLDLRKQAMLEVWESIEHANSDRSYHLRAAADSGDIRAIELLSRDSSLTASEAAAYRIASLHLRSFFEPVSDGEFDWEMKNVARIYPSYNENEVTELVQSIVQSAVCCSFFEIEKNE